jgi:DnaK suppressor protein
MAPAETEALRRSLEVRAREILHDTHRKVRDADDALPYPDNVPDAAELALDDAIKTTGTDLGERDRAVLVAIRDAFGRMRDGDYGLCVDCGEEIPVARLRAVPWASRCADDQQRAEERADRDQPGTRPTL